ncbi:MAG TPA: hypothetical protein VJ824_01460 [Bacillota bacterium]|nr:hypothetical protein [Bacillota bacterium]
MNLKESSVRILLALYRHEIMTPFQLAIHTNYHIDYIYKSTTQLVKEQLINKQSVPFVHRAAKAYYLTKKSYEWVSEMVKETDRVKSKTWEGPTGDIISVLVSNQFYTELIAKTKEDYSSGLIEWLGKKDAGDRYAQFNEKDQRLIPYSPQSYSIIQIPKGRAIVHVEVLTGDETMSVIEDYITTGIKSLQAYWLEDTPKVSMLFLCLTPTIIPSILKIWDTVEQRLPGLKPMIGAAFFHDLIQQGILSDAWNLRQRKGSLYDFAIFPPMAVSPTRFIGKQVIPQFASIGSQLWGSRKGEIQNKENQLPLLDTDQSKCKEEEEIFYS